MVRSIPHGPAWALLLFACHFAPPVSAAPVHTFDFTQSTVVTEWRPAHDVSNLRAVRDGMAITINGSDPYIHGPARNYPTGQPLWLHVRLKTDVSGMAQVFYYPADGAASEEHSVRFPVTAGGWRVIRTPLPPLSANTALRFDPPGDHGVVLLKSLSIEPRDRLKSPAWPVPVTPVFSSTSPTVVSGDLRLAHSESGIGAFRLAVHGKEMASGHTRPVIGYMDQNKVRWLPFGARAKTTVKRQDRNLVVEATARDDGGGNWTWKQVFRAGRPGSILVTSRLSCDQDRDVVFLPMLIVLPGSGSFGEQKNQALFAGLEYLGPNEPSSSEKDIIGPGAQRQVPDNARITFPLMAIQNNGRYIAMTWDRNNKFCALFDSPDRTFRSGGHAMGVLYPGSDGVNREEGNLLPYAPEHLPAHRPVILQTILMGGTGDSVVPAVQHYVSLRGLPDVPNPGLTEQDFYNLMTAGWLSSGIREGDRYRHAWPGSFGAQPSADAAWWMDWLAVKTTIPPRSRSLQEAARNAIAIVPEEERNGYAIGHNHYPVAPLLYGDIQGSLRSVRAAARDTLQRFEPDGTVTYRPAAGANDLGRTHDARHASGLTGDMVGRVLNAALLTGDADLRREGLRLLDGLSRYRNDVPRGAQTWEVPLHTPDILGSAYIGRAYVLGYELTRNPRYLDEARYWAWTGLPFVYLVKPTAGTVGPYATIAVYGATQWVAPNWMGLPVQWCGLVYAEVLDRLGRHDPHGPWKQISHGIAASGIQQTMPLGQDPNRQGLLPDSYNLQAEVRNDVHINPATLLPCAARLYGQGGFYDYHVFPDGIIVHAPGGLSDVTLVNGVHAFRVEGWAKGTYQVLLTGWDTSRAGQPSVMVDGKKTPGAPDGIFLREQGAMILELTGTRQVVVTPGHRSPQMD